MEENQNVQPALLFIPDISGFTQFVNETEITHSQSIIQELLETLIESNNIGLKIAEIEGDAIFFYRHGNTTAEELAQLANKMFVAFRQQLKKYDLSRICDCGACSAASKLSLKMVAHQGNITSYKVKEFEKLFGADVILVHRLLKNDIPTHEYFLATESIPIDSLKNKNEFGWIDPVKGSSTYDLGEVKYAYSSFNNLPIPDPPIPEVKRYVTDKPFSLKETIHIPIDVVFDTLIDLPGRTRYMDGIKEVKVVDEKHNQINRTGTRHQCIRESSTSDVFTGKAERDENRILFYETAADMPMTCDYILEKNGDSTDLTVTVYLDLPFSKMLMFNLFMKKKIMTNMKRTFANMKVMLEKQKAQVQAA